MSSYSSSDSIKQISIGCINNNDDWYEIDYGLGSDF